MTATSPASNAVVDAALADLAGGEARWAATPLRRRRELLDEVHALTAKHAHEWVEAAIAIKGLDPSSPLVGEEWMSGPYPVLTNTASLAESLRAIEAGKSPLHDATFHSAPGGRIAVQALPKSVFDMLLLNGFRADVWLQPGIDRETAKRTAGLGQLHPEQTHGIGAVLGAGNILSIAPLDVLYEIYAHNRVAALKLNPVTDQILPVLQKIFAPLIDLDVVRIFTGGADVGGYLVNHDLVKHVHITGSAASHDAIVFGAGAAGKKRKAANKPALGKPISSELGGVSPTIVFPGNWSSADLRFQAEHVATQRLHNGGYNCIAAQAILLSESWPQKDEFLAELRSAFERAPSRPAYYPGSDERVQLALDTFPQAERLGRNSERVLVTGLDPEQDDPLLRTEYFAPVLGVVELPGAGKEFMSQAVEFANDQCVGTLGVNLIAHPNTIKSLGPAFEEAIADLRYGTIAVNTWTGVGYLSSRATWGAFPGHTLNDVQSGIGVVHNGYLLEKPERTVVRGPFRPSPRALWAGELTLSPKPPWFVTNRTAATTGERLTKFAGNPNWLLIPGLFASALRG
ncbi:aldehyde dehydrogenase [Skermania sp. ID1734]|uniref:aldehyde dehydrogenase family protein n=1 Tax=Skermania sp. ID1734 TaxID=2597516 RepID=UPI001180CF4A|nr:aldehyde dehydrogenase family protein [Skermania sp. ID1734]TSD97255.1 aldehyde dehydrogenase [Skermania sp. ID1734]